MRLNNQEIPVEITTKRNLKNIVIRPKITPRRMIAISKPWHASEARALEFLESKRAWLERFFAKSGPAEIRVGDKVMICGEEYEIVHESRARLERVARSRFSIFAKRQISEYAVAIGVRPAKITIKDTTSRWGSCSATGGLALSYRLAFAPVEIAKYVIAHEMAHLTHFDHSPAFWAQVGAIYGPGWKRAKDWLAKKGATLYF